MAEIAKAGVEAAVAAGTEESHRAEPGAIRWGAWELARLGECAQARINVDTITHEHCHDAIALARKRNTRPPITQPTQTKAGM